MYQAVPVCGKILQVYSLVCSLILTLTLLRVWMEMHALCSVVPSTWFIESSQVILPNSRPLSTPVAYGFSWIAKCREWIFFKGHRWVFKKIVEPALKNVPDLGTFEYFCCFGYFGSIEFCFSLLGSSGNWITGCGIVCVCVIYVVHMCVSASFVWCVCVWVCHLCGAYVCVLVQT